MKKNEEKKRFIIRKYIMARTAREAISLDKKHEPDDVWIDEDWKKENQEKLISAIGFLQDEEE